MGPSPVFEAWKRVQLNAVNGPENTFFNIGIRLLQLPQQHLHLLPLALPNAVSGGVPRLCKAAGALEKAQVVIVLPSNDGILVDTIQGTNQFHPWEIFAVQLWHHGL